MKTIVLIEDDTVLRETTAEILELENYKVFTASNGLKGVELTKKIVPNLIICDIMMPVMDGYSVFETLSKDTKTNRIPFIFMSAKTEITDIRKGMDLGADDYLTKPISEEILLSAIDSRLAKVALLQEVETAENSSKKEEAESEYGDINTINQLKNYFCDSGKTKKYNKGETIYDEDSYSNHMYLIYKGQVKSYKLHVQGKELITSIHKEDDFFGFSSIMGHSKNYESTRAIENTEVLVVPRSDLQKIVKNSYELSNEIFQMLNENLSEVKDRLLQMAYGSMRRKTANTILSFIEKMNFKPLDSINISRQDLANVAGMATESLIRTLSDLKKDGIIEINGRNIKILDLEKLKNIH